MDYYKLSVSAVRGLVADRICDTREGNLGIPQQIEHSIPGKVEQLL